MSDPTRHNGKSIIVERSTAHVLNPLIDPDAPGETLDNIADAVEFLGRACIAMSRHRESMENGYQVCELIGAAIRYERQFL